MADVTVTSANVRRSASGVTVASAFVGEATAVTAGEVMYLDDTDLDANGQGKAKRATATGTALQATVAGFTSHPSNPGQPVELVSIDSGFIPGGTIAKGVAYVLSANAGRFCPDSDLASGHRRVDLGIGQSASVLGLKVVNTGIQL